MSRFARVAVPRPTNQTFLYKVPASLAGQIAVGSRVIVPFGPARVTGWVDELLDQPRRLPNRIRDILDAPDSKPVLDPEMVELCRWVSRYYIAPPGMTYRAALPAALSKATSRPPERKQRVLTIARELASLHERDEVFGRARRQRELYEYLESVGGSAQLAHLIEQLGISRSVVQGLLEKGLVRTFDERIAIDPLADVQIEPEPALTPTPDQARAIAQLLDGAASSRPGVFVLKGVTGSGKTLVYIELLRETVAVQGRGAIVLVPEISLTPQILQRFRAVFGDLVTVWHSALSDSERLASWRALREGEKRIVIGARSAVFAPVPDLGAIVVDEEHESSYKQSNPAPRYHAREVAVVRAASAKAICVLGSATPSLESWHNTQVEKWKLLSLPERIAARPLPAAQIVDLREERKLASAERAAGNGRQGAGPVILSDRLEDALGERLQCGEQAILLLNRRGYATFVQCRDCGVVVACRRCNVSLTEHRRPVRLVCHYCNHHETVPIACPECGSIDLSHRGVGTEQVERVLGETFPAARIARMDVDTTSARWSHHHILGRVERREVDVLLGTQMIAKGLDFPNVTLVGVINADVGLNLPDFRASERTFQLLAQVAGRAGRGPQAGEVIIQTAMPGHYAIRHALTHDYEGFAERELGERRDPSYPPYSRLVNLVLTGRSEDAVQEAADDAAGWIAGLLRARSVDDVTIVGPAPCPIDRIRRRWRWHLLLKSETAGHLGSVLEYLSRKFTLQGPGDLRLEIDRDPTSLL